MHARTRAVLCRYFPALTWCVIVENALPFCSWSRSRSGARRGRDGRNTAAHHPTDRHRDFGPGYQVQVRLARQFGVRDENTRFGFDGVRGFR